MSADARRARYVDTLRRIADLTERGVLPVPTLALSFSWWFRDPDGDLDTARHAAETAAAAVGGEWQAGSYMDARRYLSAEQRGAALGVNCSITVPLPEPEGDPEPPRPSVVFARELTVAAREARENLEALNAATITRDEAVAAHDRAAGGDR